MMKKITFLSKFLITSLVFSQSLPIDFDDNLDNNFVGAGGSVFTEIMDGGDAVGQIVGGTDQWNSRVDLALDTYIDMTTANKIFTFDFYTSEAVVMTGLFQISNEKDGGFPIEMQFTTDGNIGWQTISLDFNSATNGFPNAGDPVVYGQYAQVSIFTNFGDMGTSTYWFDDIAGAANGAAVPTDPEPTDAPTTPPTRNASDVISLFSDAYTDIPINEWSTSWDGATTIEDVEIAGNNLKKISFDVFLGIDFVPNSFNATDMTHMHIDYWVADALTGGEVFNPKWSNHTGGAGETNAIIYTNPVSTSGSWVSLDVALDDFAEAGAPGSGVARENLSQLVLDPSNTIDLIYVDNIYLYRAATASTDDFEKVSFKAYPNPTQDNWVVKSKGQSISSIQVYNILGKQVLSLAPSSNEARIDGSSLNTGLYFAKIKSDGSSQTIKLVKK